MFGGPKGRKPKADRDGRNGDRPRVPKRTPSGHDPETVDIVRRHHAGQSNAAQELFEKHEAQIRELARRKLSRSNPLRESMDSQDLAQEAVFRAYRNLDRLRVEERGQFLAWVARILDNAVRDAAAAQRALKRDVGRRASLDEGSHTQLMGAVPDDGPTPSDRVIAGEEAERLQGAFEALPTQERDVLVLRRQGRTFPAIARTLGLRSEDTARGMYQRAVETLRRRLG